MACRVHQKGPFPFIINPRKARLPLKHKLGCFWLDLARAASWKFVELMGAGVCVFLSIYYLSRTAVPIKRRIYPQLHRPQNPAPRLIDSNCIPYIASNEAERSWIIPNARTRDAVCVYKVRPPCWRDLPKWLGAADHPIYHVILWSERCIFRHPINQHQRDVMAWKNYAYTSEEAC